MGTPEFALHSLSALIGQGYKVVGAVCQPDKPKGRGHKLTPPPVKVFALEHNILVYQPGTLAKGAFLPTLEELAPDLIVVAAYGKILPRSVLNYPKYGCINVHASLLPKYRGAAPIQRCIMDGETVTGVTIMCMDEGLDTGDILLQRQIPIGGDETAAQLHDRLAELGAELLIEAVEAIKSGNVTAQKQDDQKASYAPMIDKSTALIDWTRPAVEIKNLIRAMNSWPLAYTYYNGKLMKIAKAKAAEGGSGAAPGQILGYEKGSGLSVQCGKGIILIEQLQFEGKRVIGIDEYMCGHTIEIGSILSKREG